MNLAVEWCKPGSFPARRDRRNPTRLWGGGIGWTN